MAHLQRVTDLRSVLLHCWALGLTGFGGPNVQFSNFHHIFVENLNWVDERLYQELFALNAATPGSASTGLLFSIVMVHAGVLASFIVLLVWTLPGAIGMFAIGLGIGKIRTQLPDIVYALLSGLNGATVSLIALAGIQLAERAIINKMTLLLVGSTACLALLYRALWYYPMLLAVSGIAMVIYDKKIFQHGYKWLRGKLHRSQPDTEKNQPKKIEEEEEEEEEPDTTNASIIGIPRTPTTQAGPDTMGATVNKSSDPKIQAEPNPIDIEKGDIELRDLELNDIIPYSLRTGWIVLGVFIVSLVVIMVLRGIIHNPLLKFFSNMYLAGTIICGGGPVVIPLLSDYVVGDGFVSARNFLIGLAVIQAFPGPNFNFAVFLGAASSSFNPIAGGILGYCGMYIPGILLKLFILGAWEKMRERPVMTSALKGIECGAVGLVFAAVYRLWKIGLINRENQNGSALDNDPWFVLISGTSFVASRWFGVKPPIAIFAGGILGMIWYGVVHPKD